MPDVFTDEVGTYDLTITTAADWTVSSGGMPNGDNYVTGDGTIAPVYNLNGDDFNLADGTAWTIEFWLYYTTATAVVQAIMACQDAGTVTGAWAVTFDATEQVNSSIINTGSTSFLSVTSSPLSTNTWHHAVLIKETGNVYKLWIDNVLVATDNTTSGTVRTPTSTYRLYFGAYGDGQHDFGASSSGLRVAKLAIYNRELSSGEINEHYLAMTAT